MSGRPDEGVRTREADTLLVARARDFLAGGPADVRTLVEHVCQLPGVPASVAEHMAAALFGGRPEFARDADGRWALRAPGASPVAPGEDAPEVIAADETRFIDQPLDRLTYVVVDVETTGSRAEGGDRVTEFAAVVVRDGRIAETYESLVNPQRSIPAWITSLTNISWDMVRDAPTFRDICEQVLGVLGGHVFVAHNASFDWGFVSMEVERATGRVLEGRRLCTVRLSRRLLPQLPRRSLDYVADHYGVDIGARHRAMGDALATAHVLIRLLQDAADRGCRTWGDLERLLAASTSSRRRSRRSAMPGPVTKDTTS